MFQRPLESTLIWTQYEDSEMLVYKISNRLIPKLSLVIFFLSRKNKREAESLLLWDANEDNF